MERINAIREVSRVRPAQGFSSYEGYEIETSQQVISILVSDSQDCCESWGALHSEENLESFIGANLRAITRTDAALNTRTATPGLDEGSALFITLETSRGPLQFVVYNAHNGYYGHSALVISQQLSVSETL